MIHREWCSRLLIILFYIASTRAFGTRGSPYRSLIVRLASTKTMIENAPLRHVPDAHLPSGMAGERTRLLTNVEQPQTEGSSVIYWMQRDVRHKDNWALTLASHLATTLRVPLRVVYALPPPPIPCEDDLPPKMEHLPIYERHGDFLLGGLECVSEKLHKKGIPLHILQPASHEQVGETVLEAVDQYQARVVVGDFSPLRPYRQWMELQAAPLLESRQIPFYQVDAHNIVPVWVAAGKRQVGARTLRPKIHNVYNKYLSSMPADPTPNAKDAVVLPEFDRKEHEAFLRMDKSVPKVDWATPGMKAAEKQFESFVNKGLAKFADLRNDPNEKHICSNLSPWVNHGHISFQRLALTVKKLNKYANGTASYIEEGVVRRELSDNYVYYTPNDYDELTAAADWAQETLRVHSEDPREYVYTLNQLENGQTHDDLWNAAQLQVVREGQMHGFLRMYWAKKILEWTESPSVALRTAQYFNDKYALDGRDPNGFVGVGWSIMGIHDMGWKEREIFGKIRYMNYAGCKRKFKVPAFVARYKGAAENAIEAEEKHRKRSAEVKSKPSKKQKA